MPYYPQTDYRYQFGPTDRNMLAETYPAGLSTGSTAAATAGRIEFVKIKIPVAISVTNILVQVVTVGNTLTAGQNFIALYNPANGLVGVSADQAAAWVGTGVKTAALAGGPFACVAGTYFIAFWYNGTTAPALMRAGTASSLGQNAGLATPQLYQGFADTGLTTTAPPTMGAQTAASTTWWAGLS